MTFKITSSHSCGQEGYTIYNNHINNNTMTKNKKIKTFCKTCLAKIDTALKWQKKSETKNK